MSGAYVWVEESVVHAIHDEQIAEHGGLPGTKDVSLLQSALARPQNLLNYEKPDIADLAACYGYGIARSHPFDDGNKRTAFVVTELFLVLNGSVLTADDASCVLVMLDMAAGKISEKEFAVWIRENMKNG
ncbi:MAG: type II toxin-antitoxin system death-on-curing family toxin [Alphaproteobacteria bacterium]|nr:type II toxin-antitoxin system death-on-curing family toxin [Alphaproteobacteria bacterium]